MRTVMKIKIRKNKSKRFYIKSHVSSITHLLLVSADMIARSTRMIKAESFVVN